ncbi:hypothetical protein PENSUB_12942 [Penicillium subrubescens]|uniref:Uncharacterized protein n=1 Tax=Penicillium subrubescens TaxID=1316194 RepID=A0A1Q5SV43_9EURO|nr:hypothetical protein PENSUB_12942 [Penicillium subrubescens]
MAPAPSRIAAREGDTFREKGQGPHWTAKLPLRVLHDWSLCGGPTPGAPVSPPRSPLRPRGLPRSPWHPDLCSESNTRTHTSHQLHSENHQIHQNNPPDYRDSAQDHDHQYCHPHPHGRDHPHGQGHQLHPPDYRDSAKGHDHQLCHPLPHAQDTRHSQDHSSRHIYPHGQDHSHLPRAHLYATSETTTEPSTPDYSPPEYWQPPPNEPPPAYSDFQPFSFSGQLPQIANEASVDLAHVGLGIVIPDEARWYENEEENRAAQAALDEFLENYIEPTVEEPVDLAVERTVNLPLDPTTTCEDSFSYSPLSVVPKKRVRHRVHRKNKHERKKAKKSKRPMMGQGASSLPVPVEGSPAPSDGSTGIASPTSIAETIIMASDADNVRSPPPSPSPLPTDQGMGPRPAAQGPVPQAPPKKKKKKKGKKARKAGQAGGNITGPSLDAQLTDPVSPTPEPVVSLVGATSEVETPAGVITAGQDSSPSEAPSPTVVNSGGEATTESSTPVKEYTGPCIVDTERWRQRQLARISEMNADAKRLYEARKDIGLHAVPFEVGDVFPHSVYQSENSWAQWPMESQSVPAQSSHDGGNKTGYIQPMSGVVAGACGFYPTCHHHHDQSGPRHSCCCLHGPADCWYVAPVPAGPAASQELTSTAVSPNEARRVSQMSSPKSSSLGEPVSEPIVESVASLVTASPAASTDNVPVTNVISTPANAKEMGRCQVYLGGVPTPEDLKTPSLYFDAKSKNVSPFSALASNESKPASRATSRKPSTCGSRGPETTQTGHPDETRSQACTTVPADTRRHQSIQTEARAVGPLVSQLEHVQALFGNPEFADIQLLLSPGPFHPPIVYNLHKAIIAGSPFLYSVMAAKRYRDGHVDHMRAFTGPSFTCSHAFTMALQTLYGTPLVTDETLRQNTLQGLGIPDPDDFGMGPSSFSIERAVVDFALCYAAAGAFLARREITERGIDMAISHLSWETAEFILSFAMTPLSYMAERAQTAALRFITSAVTLDFQFYRRAQSCYTPSRIPPALHTLPGSLLSNPRLEEIRFGDLPSIADERPPDPAILIPSAMLITLPYRVFMMALEIMKSRGNLSPELMNEIVEERESRRLMALNISTGIPPWEVAPEAFAELEYREFVKMDPTDHIGANNARLLRATVDRVWVGRDVPDSPLLRPIGSPVLGRSPSFGPGSSTPSNAA